MNKFNKKSNRKQTSNRNKTLKSQLKKEIKQSLSSHMELKYRDLYIAFSDVLYGAVTAGGYIFDLGIQLIGVGSGFFQRIGEQIELKNLNIKGEIGMQSGLTVDAFNKVRLIFFYWIPGSVSIPLVSDVLYNTVVGGAEVNAQYNLGKKGSLRVLRDTNYMVSSAGQMGKNFETNIPLRNRIRYDGSSALVTTNSLYMLAISDSNVSPHPIVNMCMRVSFTDD
jgi:hypothetical protein